jgi:hypothetical protein
MMRLPDASKDHQTTSHKRSTVAETTNYLTWRQTIFQYEAYKDSSHNLANDVDFNDTFGKSDR